MEYIERAHTFMNVQITLSTNWKIICIRDESSIQQKCNDVIPICLFHFSTAAAAAAALVHVIDVMVWERNIYNRHDSDQCQWPNWPYHHKYYMIKHFQEKKKFNYYTISICQW